MALRIPSPVALTKPEAYLAYKAGILSRGELKDKLLNPINNYEGWLAKWCELLETYPTNEDGTPQCLTDEEGLLAYLCGVTDRYPASNSRPDDARVSAYIRYLVSARYGRPDHPLNREEFYLSLIKPQFIPSGDPSSDIVINGTTKAPFLDVKVYGGTLQYSYSGKNLFDGVFRQGSWFNVNLANRLFSTQELLLTAGQTYTISIAGLPSGFRYAIAMRSAPFDGTGTPPLSYDSGWKTETSFTFTPSADGYYGMSVSRTNEADITPSDITGITVQLEVGSTATSYEPYTGGTPAPSPEFAIPISVVTGRQTVKVVGKNLWNGAEPLAVTGYDTYALAKPLPAGTYTFSASSITTTGTGTYSLVMFLDSANQTVASDSVVYSTKQKSFTLPSEATQVRIYSQGGYQQSQGVTTTFAGIQIESGSTATSYEAYTAQEFPIDLDTTELAGVGEIQPDGLPKYRDTIKQVDDKWYVEKQVGKVVLDGSETYNGGGTFSNAPNYCVITSRAYDSVLGAVVPAVADYFVNYSASTIYQGMPAFDEARFSVGAGSNQKLRFAMPVSLLDMTTTTTQASSFTDWVTAHNITIYYALATPTTTEITNQSLIDQLNALKQGGAEEGTTYIRVSATDPNLPAKLYVEAPKYD